MYHNGQRRAQFLLQMVQHHADLLAMSPKTRKMCIRTRGLDPNINNAYNNCTKVRWLLLCTVFIILGTSPNTTFPCVYLVPRISPGPPDTVPDYADPVSYSAFCGLLANQAHELFTQATNHFNLLGANGKPPPWIR